MQHTFTAYNPYIKSLKTDKSYRLELDISFEDAKILMDSVQLAGTFTVAIAHNPNQP